MHTEIIIAPWLTLDALMLDGRWCLTWIAWGVWFDPYRAGSEAVN